MLKRTALKPGKPLARTPMKPRKAPLRPKSLAAARQGQALKLAYRLAPDAGQNWCSVCGVVGERLEHSHFFTQKLHPEHRANYLNWEMQCRNCHSAWEDNKAAFAAAWPEAWERITSQMRALDVDAFRLFELKNNL